MRNPITTFVFFLIFQCCGILLFGGLPIDINKFEFFNKKQRALYQIDIHQNIVTIYRIPQKDTLVKTLKSEGLNLTEIPPSFLSNVFEKKPGIYWFTILGTGQVYEFALKDFSLKRLDDTFFRGYNFQAIQFIYKDTLFSFGGMGFWHSHNITTYFDAPKKEWEMYLTNKNTPKRFSKRIGGYSSAKKIVYAAEMPDIYEDQEKTPSILFKFNLQNKTWEKLGTINTLPKGFWDHDRLEGRWIDPFLFSEELENYFIDTENNNVHALTGRIKLFFHAAVEISTENNFFYILRKNNTPSQTLLLDSISVDEVRKNSKIVGKFYTPISTLDEINIPYTLLGLGMAIASLLGFFLFISRKKVKKLALYNQNGPPENYDEFISFILNKRDLSCSTGELNDIISVSDKPLDTQRQYRSKFISQVNLYIFTEYGIEEGIERETAKDDKRFVYYKVSKALLKKLKGI